MCACALALGVLASVLSHFRSLPTPPPPPLPPARPPYAAGSLTLAIVGRLMHELALRYTWTYAPSPDSPTTGEGCIGGMLGIVREIARLLGFGERQGPEWTDDEALAQWRHRWMTRIR